MQKLISDSFYLFVSFIEYDYLFHKPNLMYDTYSITL